MNPHDVIRYADRSFRSAIDALATDDWDRVCAGVWRARDVLGHLSAIHGLTVSVLAGFAGQPAPPAEQGLADDVDFNMSQAAIRASWPLERLLGEYDTTAAELRRLAALVDDETWGRVGAIPWYGSEYSLEDLVVYRVYGHVREHATHLGMAVDLGRAARGDD